MEPHKCTEVVNFEVWNYERHKCRYLNTSEEYIPVGRLTAPTEELRWPGLA